MKSMFSYRWLGVILLALPGLNAAALPGGAEPTVLLITDSSLAQAWQPFADFKTRLGYPTSIVTVQQIERDTQGVDAPAKIRAYILNAIEQGQVRHVILGGDSDPEGGLVPDRDTLHRQMRYRDIPTDLYYLSPGEFDWDANGDGVFGDWEADREAIRYGHPSGAAIGRIPVRTAADVAAYSDKVIAYETRYPEQDFATRIIYTNTIDASEPKVRRSWDDYLSQAWADGEAFRFLHTHTAWDQDQAADFALNKDNWIQIINANTAGKMHMHGHGFLPAWVLEHPTGNSYVDAGVVGQLANQDAYLAMTTVSCYTGQYDSPKDPSIVERMLREPGRGAVLVIAPSREGVPIFHNPQVDFRLMVTEGKLDGTTESMTRFWINGLSPTEDGGYRTAGQAFIQMKQEMAEHAAQTAGYHWCQTELNFLGDPTLDLRAKDPVKPTVAAPESIGLGRQTIEIATGLVDRPGVRVCVWKGDEVYVVSGADQAGVARIDVEPTTTGELLVTISGPSVNAFMGTIQVR